MDTQTILITFVCLRIAQYVGERYLANLNYLYIQRRDKQQEAISNLGVTESDLSKSLSYAQDKYYFSRVSNWFNLTVLLVFLSLGGPGYFERWANSVVGEGRPIIAGLFFFGLFGLSATLMSLPFSYYHTFYLEEKHGFNRQTKAVFFTDLAKSLVVGTALGAPVLALLLYIMEKAGNEWWLLAWLTISGFSIFTAWLYPTVLAPLFNKFSPLPEGEVKERILALAAKLDFKTNGLFVMNASLRSSHGNAYFTGLFSKKRIVLFDTLLDALNPQQIVAVLAHELGHFKLNHVRWMLIRSVVMTGVVLYLLSLCLPLAEFYQAFGLKAATNYGALFVFSLWFGLIDFLLNPMQTYISRKNEFAADDFAVKQINDRQDLASALLKLREKSHSMPISHPWYSAMYYSHPPILERITHIQTTK